LSIPWIQQQLETLSAPFRLWMEDFFRETDIQTTITLFQLELCSRLTEEWIGDPDMTLWALFDDSNDENWGNIETRWADVLRKYQEEIEYILKRSGELLFDIDTADITPENEREWDDLWEKYDSLVIRMLDEINQDITSIIEWLRNIPEIKI
jgi:hypothetical protein